MGLICVICAIWLEILLKWNAWAKVDIEDRVVDLQTMPSYVLMLYFKF